MFSTVLSISTLCRATDDRSVHGFPEPVRGEGHWRRSIALYYYTSTEAPGFSGDTTTYTTDTVHEITGSYARVLESVGTGGSSAYDAW